MTFATPQQSLDRDGFFVARSSIRPSKVEAARRRILLEIRHHGLSAYEIETWQDNTYFPWLRDDPAIRDLTPEALAEFLFDKNDETDFWAEPQILLKFPDVANQWVLRPHVDELPPWAASVGATYKGILGVPLTSQTPADGSPIFWVGSNRNGTTEAPLIGPDLDEGDVVAFLPETGHSGGLNTGSTIRMTIYFRLMTVAR